VSTTSCTSCTHCGKVHSIIFPVGVIQKTIVCSCGALLTIKTPQTTRASQQKRLPIAICNTCGKYTTDVKLINTRHGPNGSRWEAGKEIMVFCNGSFISTQLPDDWKECPSCHATGEMTTYSGSQGCYQCQGLGWIFVKRLPPVAVCNTCRRYTKDVERINTSHGPSGSKWEAGKELVAFCNGSFISTQLPNDWKECPSCHATGYVTVPGHLGSNKECDQCHSWGWMFVRDTKTAFKEYIKRTFGAWIGLSLFMALVIYGIRTCDPSPYLVKNKLCDPCFTDSSCEPGLRCLRFEDVKGTGKFAHLCSYPTGGVCRR